MNEEKRINIGFEIIESRTIGSAEIVIGHNPNAVNPYVCWYCKDKTNYYWGRYVNTLDAAKAVMHERSEYQARVLLECQTPPKKRDAHER